jgi:hypothetical protein
MNCKYKRWRANGLDVQGAEVADIIRDNSLSLGPREGEHFGIRKRFSVCVSGHGLDVMPPGGQLAGDSRREHLVEEESHRLTAGLSGHSGGTGLCGLLVVHFDPPTPRRPYPFL